MLNCKKFYELLVDNEVDFFTGVPDSLLKYFNAYILDNVNDNKHIIAANEGASIALATGHYLATTKIGLVYMQNSGLGNAVNPLTSLVDPDVYGIPILLLIGWRGEPGEKDEPQHTKQGRITLELLNTLEIPYDILPNTIEDTTIILNKAFMYMKKFKSPYALVVRKGIFEKYDSNNKNEQVYDLSRENAIKLILTELNNDDVIISTTGMTSRELFECREKMNQDHCNDFLTVGSMGHASQIALGIAMSTPDRQIFCLDGDGALIMHMGSLGIIGSKSTKNFKHIVLNNAAHDSVGGQPTIGYKIDITSMALSCKYNIAYRAETKTELIKKLSLLKSVDGPALLEVRINKGNRKDIGRPTTSPKENKESFMNSLSK
jgi:phosphonopyruvate decarboxylase